MPTYRNNTNLKPVIDGKVINPGQTVHSLKYLDEDAEGLQLVDEAPYYNPVLLATRVCGTGMGTISTIQIPKTDNLRKPVTKYAIHFYVEKGTVEIRYNVKENNPPLSLYTGAKWNVRYFERHVDKLLIDSSEPFVLYVIIEKIS